jgi:uncharacterized protein YecE (DUF72 family)
MEQTFRIGCSGYYYPSWKNGFYPAGLQPKNWLAYYSSVFNTVELNGTFYRTPKLADLQKYAAVTPDDFRFSVKMNKIFTHTGRLKGVKQEVLDLQAFLLEGLNGKLLHYLFQLPPSFHFSEENLERILESVPHSAENVVELRHVSWWNETVREAFRSAEITFCNVDFPGLESYFISTTPYFYLRLHGNPDLFKSSYSEEALEGFYRQLPRDAERCSVYFNNTYYEAGYTNARQFQAIHHK